MSLWKHPATAWDEAAVACAGAALVDPGVPAVAALAAGGLPTLDVLGPSGLPADISAAHSVGEVVDCAARVPGLFLELLDAELDAPAIMRVITKLSDAMTTRLLELTVERLGPPPVPYAWLALGSAARSELTPGSDQDNGLAYADSDDPTADDYFKVLGREVNEALGRCGFVPDAHGVLARERDWRMPASQWCRVFTECLWSSDCERLIRAAIAFDVRHVAGDLLIVPLLMDIVREAPRHARFLGGLSDLGAEIPSPLGFRQRLKGPVDIKRSGLLPVQNMARYFAFAAGFTPSTTLERLAAVEEARTKGSESGPQLREAFARMATLQLRHHGEAIRQGRRPDDRVETDRLPEHERSALREVLRAVSRAQGRLPQRVTLWRSAAG